MRFIRNLLIAALILIPGTANASLLANPEQLANLTLLEAEVPDLNNVLEIGPFTVSDDIVITWLVTNTLNLTATIGSDIVDGSPSATYVPVWPGVIQQFALGVPVAPHMRASYDTDEGASLLTIIDESPSSASGTVAFSSFYFGDTINLDKTTYRYTIVCDSYTLGTAAFFLGQNGSASDEVESITATGAYTGEHTITGSGTLRLWGRSNDPGNDLTATFTITLEQIIPAFLNSVSKADSTKLTPSKLGDNGEEIFLLYDYWPGATEVVAADTYAYVAGSDGHNYAMHTTAGGTTGGSLPSVDAGDIGGTVSDGGVTWDVESHYTDGATAAKNYLTHVLNEPGVTNLQLFSNDLTTGSGAGWTANGETQLVSTVVVNAPNGEQDAYLLSADGTGSAAKTWRTSAADLATETTYVVSKVFKKQVHDYVRLRAVSNANGSAWFNLLTGDPGTVEAGLDDAGMEGYGDGWWRCWIKFTTPASITNNFLDIGLATANDEFLFTGVVGEGIYIYQLDKVAASAISSIIPTTTTTVSRGANVRTSPQVPTVGKKRFRLALENLAAQVLWGDGTSQFEYTGTALLFTDGTNNVDWTVDPVHGDIVGLDETTGQLYYNGVNVATNALISPTWGTPTDWANITDFMENPDMDLTDNSWSDLP
jgi:hypothetical protein